MVQFEQHFVQDLTQPIKVRHCGTIVFNADDESNVISVRLFNGSEPVAISGSVVGAVVCSDGSTVPLTGSYSGNTASITLTGDCFAVLGQIGVGIQIVNGTQKTTVLKVIYNVETLTTENVVDPGSRITLEVGDLIAAIDEAVASIPEDYSALTSEVEDIKAVNKIFNRDVVGVPNPIDTATWIDNANLNDSGATNAAQGWKVTEGYIETSADSYKISYNNSETMYIVQAAGYTSNGSFVRMFANADSSSGVRSFTIDTTSVDKIRIATRYGNPILSVYPNDGKIVEKLASVEDDVSDLKSQITYTVDTAWNSVALTTQQGYYKKGNGEFTSDEYRRCAVVSNVVAGEVYRVTTHTKTTNIAGIIYKDSNGDVLSYDLDGTGSDQDHVNYEFSIPTGCVTLIVQSSTSTAPVLDKKSVAFKAYTKAESDAKYAPLSVEDDIEAIEDVVYEDGWQAVSLTAEQGYYKKGNGEWTSDSTRRCAVVSGVVAGDVYRVTTHTKTTNIAGIIYKDTNGDVISFDLEGTGADQDHVNYQFTIPNNCVTLIVQSSTTTMPTLEKKVDVFAAYTKEEADAKFASRSTGGETVAYIETIDIKVGSDVMGNVDTSDGWTVSDGTYTHNSGNTNVLSINTSAEVGEIYLLEFDSVTPEETVRIGLGDTAYRMNIYTDSEHKNVPLKAYGNCKLYIEPISSSYTGSISNIILRKIQDSGTDKTLTVYSVLTDNHANNYGFYNTLIGGNTLEGSPGSTRTVALGMNALRDLQAGHRNIGIGTFAMSQMKYGEGNISIGADSMLAVKQSDGCVAIGKSALYNGTENKSSVAIGVFAGFGSNSSAGVGSCTMIGAYAGTNNRANYNTFIGTNAGYSVTTGTRNTLIGANINGQSTGDDNTCIGRSSGYPSGANHCIAIGKDAVATASGQMMLGSSNVTEVVFCGNKKINFNLDGTVTWETLT